MDQDTLTIIAYETAFSFVPFFWRLFWPLVVLLVGTSLIAGALSAILGKLAAPNAAYGFRERFAGGATITLLGLTTGLISGMSRQTVTGDILPVLLTAAGAIAGYVVLQRKLPMVTACAAIFGFCIALLGGLLMGSTLRESGAPQFQVNEPLDPARFENQS